MEPDRAGWVSTVLRRRAAELPTPQACGGRPRLVPLVTHGAAEITEAGWPSDTGVVLTRGRGRTPPLPVPVDRPPGRP